MIKDYYQHPLFIQALVDSVLAYQEQHGKPEKLLMSFHGIPQPYADKGDPYADRCRMTARLIADALQLKDDAWAISFQSRFGKQEWVKPYTVEEVARLARAGKKRIAVMAPAFSADCVETLEEINEEIRHSFVEAGGESFTYIPCLNADAAHMDALTGVIRRELAGWV